MSVRFSKRVHVTKKVLLVFAVVIIASTTLIAFLYTSPLLIVTERLRAGQFEFDGEDRYAAKVMDSDGNDLAHPYFRIPSEVSTAPVRILFSMWHAEETKLDSLSLVFSSDDVFFLALTAPKGFPSMDFHETRARPGGGMEVVLDIPDLGSVGRGTVRLKFFLELISNHLDLNISVKFSLHKEPPFSFTRYTADASLNVAVERLE